jgi:bifunctional non-homologous end joining protein LigD
MFKHACSVGLEGVVSKVRDGRYRSGRSNDWVKVTCQQRETLPIAGFAIKDHKFDGIYVGRHKGKQLVYAGKVDHGFDSAAAKEIQARLKPLIRKTQPYAKRIAIKASGSSRRYWLRSNTERNQPKGRCATRSTRACGRTYDKRH